MNFFIKLNMFVLLFISFYICLVYASSGDTSQFYINCVKRCNLENCTKTNHFTQQSKIDNPQSIFEILLFWRCSDECNYDCMWRTTYGFIERKWKIPQFNGKWPFIRFCGLQEPASVLFSLFNLLVHCWMMRKFRQEVREDSPMYWEWLSFCGICLNAWVFSIIFHARDFPITELFDYCFAYSMVLTNLLCMILRVFNSTPRMFRGTVIGLFGFYFYDHFIYLSFGQFDYSYNMNVNIITGSLAGLGWMAWYLCVKHYRLYAWKIAVFQIMVGMLIFLELYDFPPILWTFDSHSIWHLMTVFPTILFYRFIIEDCKSLRNEKEELETEREKLL